MLFRSSQNTDGTSPYQCKYEMHRFHKFVWKKLKRYARNAYDVSQPRLSWF